MPQQALDLIGQSLGQMAGSGMVSLGVFSREENRAAVKVQMLGLDSNELADTATQFVDCLEYELVPVVVDAVEELGQLVDSEIPNDLAESFVLS